MILWLKAKVGGRRAEIGKLHEDTLKYTDDLSEQYPLSFYPITYKSIELAYLHDEMSELFASNARFVECAIGEGTLSRRVFPPEANVVGLDISPMALRRAAKMPHVKDAIICDIFACPVKPGSFDALVSNNFLHHVTNKERVLEVWAGLSPVAYFNECTEYWKTAWPVPYAMARMGMKDLARRTADKIEYDFKNTFLPADVVDAKVQSHHDIVRRTSFLSESTMMMCFLFGNIMRTQGPLTGEAHRWVLWFCTGPLRGIVMPATKELARLLIIWDAFQDRSRDAYVSYTIKSRSFLPSKTEGYLTCPECHAEMDSSARCGQCGKQYNRIAGILFLLPKELDHIETGFDPRDERYLGGSE
jgi:hypothetical protein